MRNTPAMVKAIIKIGHEYFATNEYANDETLQQLITAAFKSIPHNARLFNLKLKRLAGYKLINAKIDDNRTYTQTYTISKARQDIEDNPDFKSLYEIDIINRSYTFKKLRD